MDGEGGHHAYASLETPGSPTALDDEWRASDAVAPARAGPVTEAALSTSGRLS